MDERAQQELEEERLRTTLEVLDRVAQGTSNATDAEWLASELGVTHFYPMEAAA